MQEDTGILGRLTRRRVLGTASLLPLAGLVPDLLSQSRAAAQAGGRSSYRFFSPHEGEVIDAATRRIAPGPEDDPLELGHPGAHECHVVNYIDTMLGMFDFPTPRVFAGGPWSNRHTKGPNHMKTFVKLDRAQAQAWRKRIKDLQRTYREGVRKLDSHADGDFSIASKIQQDLILAKADVAPFTSVLFGHTIEGMYSNPEYGGNKDLQGWKEIHFPGDIQPRGYRNSELGTPEFSLVDPTGIVEALLADFPKIAQAYASGVWRA